MMKRLDPPGSAITFTFEGREIAAVEGDTIATALLAAGVKSFGAFPANTAQRGPWCMMGACYGCLVDLGGLSVQACMTAVEQGQIVRSCALPGEEA